jgi:Fe-S-cluster containining protein
VDERSGQRDAGEFGSWLAQFQGSLRDGAPADVPCDGCTACCRSGKLIPVEPDEADALAHIPAGSLTPMPGEPQRRVLKHDEAGRCSQLTEGGCAVYEHRPRACRAYDCRIFPAAGIRPDSPLIAERVEQWRFSYATDVVRESHDAVRMAAVVLGFPGGLSGPASPTQHALDAIESAGDIAQISDISGSSHES